MISHLGRFEVVDKLGQGAMGIVYKAKDHLIDRNIALKTISINLADDNKYEYEGRFFQEAKAAGSLNHPNIVTIYDVGKCDDIAYIAMEFLEGRELRNVLYEDPLLPINQVIDIVIQVAKGLACAHEHGVVHLDLKPSNVMCVGDGQVKITDFGIAIIASSLVRTNTGIVLGSPKYMSPEQVQEKLIDSRSDIFSLGVILYEMLTGNVPFQGNSASDIMYRIVNTIPRPPSEVNPLVPAMLDFIVTKAMAKTPDGRYPDAVELTRDLMSCHDTLPRSEVHVDLRRSRFRKPDALLTDPVNMIRRREASEEVITKGLSNNFNSSSATVRLAEMTAPDYVEELGKSL
jgi:serine/threonine-protein kinase